MRGGKGEVRGDLHSSERGSQATQAASPESHPRQAGR